MLRQSLAAVAVIFSLVLFTNISYAAIYASDVLWDEGSNINDPSRKITSNALGVEDGVFLSLGLDGAAVFSFGQLFDGSASVFEITNGSRSGYPEYLEVYVGNTWSTDTNGFDLVTTIQNSVHETVIDLTALTGPFSYLLLKDVTANFPDGRVDGDGFDIDAVRVNPVPLPAAIWLLGSGLLGLVGYRRFRNN